MRTKVINENFHSDYICNAQLIANMFVGAHIRMLCVHIVGVARKALMRAAVILCGSEIGANYTKNARNHSPLHHD